MISDILPAGVAAVEALGDDPAAILLAEEEAALGAVAEGRKREFETARSCARRALAKLGLPPAPILPGLHREPLWPFGVVGSITHYLKYRAAAVARKDGFLSIGIDAEPHGELPVGVLQKVALPEEQRWIRILSGTGVHWDRIVFSSKESVYKAWFPMTGRWLGFKDAFVQVDPARGTFQVRLLIPGPIVNGRRIEGLDGCFSVSNGLVLTFVGIAVPGFSQQAHR